ncbi:S8 family serine peptidase [Pseudobacteriovorax antillogorgiicola]|uniref:PA domain-containing protein n=1 Tax=Pseudobacteriovorax antillogorgiicola TaxID=1513793 RepID=A0A1Y6CNH6_9BACT|nr:S8 family serine peptidase [Pseudobacteriovorax antillogorgiicola]TCS44620.1 PA domain-containing protein [Pseudobacteriovorax antillogorgiicola]SMF78357.1 PA domain-containing protein [Pseudobacteriovorax antillogorgiicola]
MKTSLPIVLGLLGVLTMTGCSNSKKNKDDAQATIESKEGQDLNSVSGRPAEVEQFLATVQFSEPALLTSSRYTNGKHVVDEALKERILNEHQQFKEMLEYLSPAIKIIHEYKMVLNGMTVLVPGKYQDRFYQMTSSMNAQSFKPQLIERADIQEEAAFRNSWGEVTSASFINASAFQSQFNARGEGIKVGIIDTGIDYTHKMFGGLGDATAYQNNDPKLIEDQSFPTAKVAGGYDFVGESYNSGGLTWDQRLPQPDPDPLDIGGHGTHVAGTVAGLGDGVNTYDGVAPKASLYALKVFGTSGSTSDSVVIAALEYAADPNGDLDPADKLDVVNLSLGGAFGSPNSLYDIAMRNLTIGRIMPVISAGNSGDRPYIVGSPSTTAESISVAASVDAMDHNWRSPALKAGFSGGDESVMGYAPSAITIPADGFSEAKALVDLGLGTSAPDDDTKADLLGKFALISRGETSFCSKGLIAQDGGAAGFVVYNNAAGDPITMGGDCMLQIPGVMISLADGDAIKEAMNGGDVMVTLDAGVFEEAPENIDKIAGFSSRGPRSIDSLLKPEITAPGVEIVSAAVGSGFRGVRFGGTSMAAPHVAGAAALLRQAFPNASVAELKSRMMNTSLTMKQDETNLYPLSRQGAGRIDILRAAQTPATVSPSALSLGQVSAGAERAIRVQFRVENSSDESQTFQVLAQSLSPELRMSFPSMVSVGAGEATMVRGDVHIESPYNAVPVTEIDGFVNLVQNSSVVLKIPVHGVRVKAADIRADRLTVASSSVDYVDAPAHTKVSNDGNAPGEALIFNLLAQDERAARNLKSSDRTFCDLQSVGYRVVDDWTSPLGGRYLDIAFKLYNPVTDWIFCQPTALIDMDGDELADFEVFGSDVQSYSLQIASEDNTNSILVDAERMRDIRRNYDLNFFPGQELDFGDAILDLQAYQTYNFSTVAMLRINLEAFDNQWQEMKLMPGVLSSWRGRAGDDFVSKWQSVYIDPAESSFFNFDPQFTVRAGDFEDLDLVKGIGQEPLILFYPQNAANFSVQQNDMQSQVLKPRYQF